MEAVEDFKDAVVTAMVGDEATEDGAMVELLVGEGAALDLVTMARPSSLRSPTTLQ